MALCYTRNANDITGQHYSILRLNKEQTPLLGLGKIYVKRKNHITDWHCRLKTRSPFGLTRQTTKQNDEINNEQNNETKQRDKQRKKKQRKKNNENKTTKKKQRTKNNETKQRKKKRNKKTKQTNVLTWRKHMLRKQTMSPALLKYKDCLLW